MKFTNPEALILAALALPVVLLYLRRVRPVRRSVAAGFLWEQVFGAPERRSAWWMYRHPVSLCVQLAVLGLLVVALAEPHVRPPATLVLVIDNSASMSATDASPSRLERAKGLARERVAALGPDDRAAIVTVADTIRVRSALTNRPDLLEPALAGIEPTREGSRVWEAVSLVRRSFHGGRNQRIVVYSDGCFEGAAELAGQDGVELIVVGQRSDNLAITRLEARRCLDDPRRCQVLAEVTRFADEPVACRLALELDGRPIDAVAIELDSAGRWQRVFAMRAPEEGRLDARLDRPDVLREDNQASARVPPCSAPEVGQGEKGAEGAEGDEPRPSLRSGTCHPAGTRLASAESDVRVPAGLEAEGQGLAPGASGPPVWLLLAVAALVVVAAEWCLFQRRWTC